MYVEQLPSPPVPTQHSCHYQAHQGDHREGQDQGEGDDVHPGPDTAILGMSMAGRWLHSVNPLCPHLVAKEDVFR